MTKNKTLIILDTNILTESDRSSPDYSSFVSNSRFKDFLSFLEKHKIKEHIVFGIPRIVFEEHYFHKKNKFDKDFLNLKEKVSQFNKMKILKEGELNLSFEESFDYKNYLLDFISMNKNFVLLETDEEKKKKIFENVLNNAINHRKQFEKKGDSNFKDALIWECICCQNFRSYYGVIFLHQNQGDFPDNNDIKELNRASKETGKIIHVLNNYKDVEKDLEEVYMFTIRELKEYLNDDYFKARLKEEIEEEAGFSVEIINPSFNIEELKVNDFEEEGINPEDKNNFRWVHIKYKTNEGEAYLLLLFDIINKGWKIKGESSGLW